MLITDVLQGKDSTPYNGSRFAARWLVTVSRLTLASLLLAGCAAARLAGAASGWTPERDRSGALAINIIVENGGRTAYEYNRKPLGDHTEASLDNFRQQELDKYTADYDPVGPASTVYQCSGHVLHRLGTTFGFGDVPKHKFNLDNFVSLLKAQTTGVEKSTPQTGDIIFWAPEDVHHTAGGDQHVAIVVDVKPATKTIVIETKDGDEGVYQIEAPYDPNEMWHGSRFLANETKGTQDPLLLKYKKAHRYRLPRDLKFDWEYWQPPNTDLSGIWVDEADATKIHEIRQTSNAGHAYPLTFRRLSDGAETVGAFQDGKVLHRCDWTTSRDQLFEIWGEFTGDTITWYENRPHRTGPIPARMRLLGRWQRLKVEYVLTSLKAEIRKSQGTEDPGSKTRALGTASGNIPVSYSVSGNGGRWFKKMDATIFYDFPEAVKGEKEGGHFKVEFPIGVRITKAVFSNQGLSGDKNSFISIGPESAFVSTYDGARKSKAKVEATKPSGNYVTTYEPLHWKGIYSNGWVRLEEPEGQTLTAEVKGAIETRGIGGLGVDYTIIAEYSLQTGTTSSTVQPGALTIDPARPPAVGGAIGVKDPGTGDVRYRYAEVLAIENVHNIQIRLPGGNWFPLRGEETGRIPEYAELKLGHGAALTLLITDPADESRKIKLIFKEGTYGKLSTFWGPSFDTVSIHLNTGTLIADASGLAPRRVAVTTPVSTVEATGTAFSVEYDDVSKRATVKVASGSVTVKPSAPRLSPVVLTGQQQLTVGLVSIGPIVPAAALPEELALRAEPRPRAVPVKPATEGADDELAQLLADTIMQIVEQEFPDADSAQEHAAAVPGRQVGGGTEPSAVQSQPSAPPGAKEQEVAALISRLKDGTAPERIQASMEIAQHGEAGAPAIPALIPLLQNDDPSVRVAAAHALGGIGYIEETDNPAVLALTSALNDPSHIVRLEAIRALESIGFWGRYHSIVVNALRQLLADPDAWVSANARQVLDSAGER